MQGAFYYQIAAVQLMLAFAILGAPLEAFAQEDSCAPAIEKARNQYQGGNFDDAIQLLYECLIREDVRPENIVEGHRLLALSYLRKDDLANARLTIVRLLNQAPDYTPDPIRDPPSYVSFVGNVKAQLDVQSDSVADQRTSLAPRWTPEVLFVGGVGFTHYGGERGYLADNAIHELSQGAGPAIKLKATYQFSPRFGGGINYQAGRFPELLRERGGSQFGAVDEATSSAWIHGLGLFSEIRFLLQASVAPYLHGGIISVYTLKNDVFRAGFGPQVGVGIGVPVFGEVDFFGEATGSFIFPGDTLDLVDQGNGYDSIFLITVGLRYRLQGL